MLHFKMFHHNSFHVTVVHRHPYIPRQFVHYYIFKSALAAVSSFSFTPSTILFPNFSADIASDLLNMAPKRKATDAGSSTSPLKKRNAVTAGIGRAVESESNGNAFGYYGRNDDREDVSKPSPPFLCRSCPDSQPQLTSYYILSPFNALRCPQQSTRILAQD